MYKNIVWLLETFRGGKNGENFFFISMKKEKTVFRRSEILVQHIFLDEHLGNSRKRVRDTRNKLLFRRILAQDFLLIMSDNFLLYLGPH